MRMGGSQRDFPPFIFLPTFGTSSGARWRPLCRPCLVGREFHNEAGTFARTLGFGPNSAPVDLYHLLGDKETIARGTDVYLGRILALADIREHTTLFVVALHDPSRRRHHREFCYFETIRESLSDERYQYVDSVTTRAMGDMSLTSHISS